MGSASTKEKETAINKDAAAAAEAAEEAAREAVEVLTKRESRKQPIKKHGVVYQAIITNGRNVQTISAAQTSYQGTRAAVEAVVAAMVVVAAMAVVAAMVVVATMVEEVHIISRAITIKGTVRILHLLQDHISSSPEDHLTFQRYLQAKEARRIIINRTSSSNNSTILTDVIDNQQQQPRQKRA